MGKPRDLANVVATGNILADGAVAPAELTGVTSTAAEINILDGVTATAAELNILDGVTATTAELNHVDGVTSNVQTQMDTKAPVASPTFTGTVTGPTINASTALQIGGTAITATAAELNTLDGITASVSDLNGVAGINSNVQTQLNLKAPLAGPTFTGTVTIGGATYPTSDGSAGQILTTNGSGAVSFADPAGGGGQFDAVASGAIANGALVSLNSDGTVSTTSAYAGAEQVIENTSASDFAATYDTNANKVVFAYLRAGVAYAVVGTISGTSISFGTPVQISSGSASHIDVTFDSNSNKVVVVGKLAGNDGAQAVVGTVSGTAISFGSITDVEQGSGEVATYIKCTFDSNSNKVVVAYRYHDGSQFRGKCRVGTVSGTSISFGSDANVLNGNCIIGDITFDSNSNKVVVTIQDNTDSAAGKAVIGTVSGTSISFGTGVAFAALAQSSHSCTFDSNSNKVVIIYEDNANSGKLTGIVGTVSGTSISFGSSVVIYANSYSDEAITFDSNLNKVFVVFTDNNQDTAVLSGTVSGTSISFGNPSILNPRADHSAVTFDPDTNKLAIVYRDEGNADRGTAVVGVPIGIDNFLKWIGFASSAISDTATGTINVLGGINESQSSLEVGSTYYLTNDATLSTTIVSGREVGKALSATKLLITQGSVS